MLRLKLIHVSKRGHWGSMCQLAPVNTLRPRENGRHFADDSFKCIFLNENFRIWNEISLKFVPKGQINKVPSLVQALAWCRPGDKPLSEPMVVRSLTHICVTRPQWVKTFTEPRLMGLIQIKWNDFVIVYNREINMGILFLKWNTFLVQSWLGLMYGSEQNCCSLQLHC